MSEKDLIIRDIKPIEYSFLKEMLYQAIFVADKKIVLPREIIEHPDLRKYIQDFGKTGDFCLVAEQYGKLIGAIWIRFIKGYGFVENGTPELSMAVLNEHRGNGIGKQLLTAMIDRYARPSNESILRLCSAKMLNYIERTFFDVLKVFCKPGKGMD